MQTLFDQRVHQQILSRINQLSENSSPHWGKMTVAQMVKHCQMPLLVASGKMELTQPIGFLRRMGLKLYKSQLYNDKPWPKSLVTPTDFKITDQPHFQIERDKLVATINDFHGKALNIRWPSHPYFGEFTTDQWGKMQYKHLDHHLRQFGA